MYHWYNPYLVPIAYLPHAQQISKPLDMSRDMTALPNGPSPFPPVQTALFHNSAKQSLKLMKQVELLVTKISESDAFANELMMAAQNSNQKRVDEMIVSTGLTANHQTNYTPDGIRILFKNSSAEGPCCELLLVLHW